MDPRKRDHLIEQLSSYLDGELPAARCREVEAFLAEDAEARSLLAELRATAAALHDLPRATASDRLLEGIRTRMERQALLGEVQPAMPAPPKRSFGLRWVAAAAVIGLAFVTLYMVGPMSRREPAVITVASNDRKDAVPDGKQIAVPMTELTQDTQERSAGREDIVLPASPSPAKQPSGPMPPPELEMFARSDSDLGKVAQRRMEPVVSSSPSLYAQVVPEVEAQLGIPARAAQPAGDQTAVDKASRPGRRRVDMPLVALVELNTSDPAAQQQAAQLLKEQFAFYDTAPSLLARSAERDKAKAAGDPVTSEGLLLDSRGLQDASSHNERAHASTLGFEFESMEKAKAERTVSLTRMVPDDALARTLEQVQSQWPAATVRYVTPADALAAGERRGGEMPLGRTELHQAQDERSEVLRQRLTTQPDSFAAGSMEEPGGRRLMKQDAATRPHGNPPADHLAETDFARVPASEAPAAPGLASAEEGRPIAFETAPAESFGMAVTKPPAGGMGFGDTQPAARGRYLGGGFGGRKLGYADSAVSSSASQLATPAATAPAGEQSMILVHLHLTPAASRPVDTAKAPAPAQSPATAPSPASGPSH